MSREVSEDNHKKLAFVKLGKSGNSGGKRLSALRRTGPTSRVCKTLSSHSLFSRPC